MRYETIHNLQIPKIGFGTWSFGGTTVADHSGDAESLSALRSALDLGYIHFDTAESYSAGHSEELLGQAVRQSGIPREKLFITTKVSPDHLQFDDVLRSCEGSLRRLGMDYVDLYLIHWPQVGMKLPETFRALNQLVCEGKVRHVGVSNFNLKQLKQSVELCETPLLTNQVSYSIPDRTIVKKGVLEYCQQNNVLVTAYSPVKRRNVKSNAALAAIAEARGASPQQIALAWLITQPRVIAIPMSHNPQHQAQNLAAGDMLLTEIEMEQLNQSMKQM